MREHSRLPTHQELVLYYQMQFSIIPRAPRLGTFYPLFKRNSQHTIRHVNLARGLFLNELMLHRSIGLVGRVFANGQRDQDSIPGRVIPKTQKMLLDAALLCT